MSELSVESEPGVEPCRLVVVDFAGTLIVDDGRVAEAFESALGTQGVTGFVARSVAAVGDTASDLLAGSAAGVGWNIGVLSGAHDRTHLEGVPHTHLFPSVADVPAPFGVHAEG